MIFETDADVKFVFVRFRTVYMYYVTESKHLKRFGSIDEIFYQLFIMFNELGIIHRV